MKISDEFLPDGKIEQILDIVERSIRSPAFSNQYGIRSNKRSRIATISLVASAAGMLAMLICYGLYRWGGIPIPAPIFVYLVSIIDVFALGALAIEIADSLIRLYRLRAGVIKKQLEIAATQYKKDRPFLVELTKYKKQDLILAKSYIEVQKAIFDGARSSFAGPVEKVGLLPVAIGFAVSAPKISEMLEKIRGGEGTVWVVIAACALIYLLTWITQGYSIRIGLGVNLLDNAIQLCADEDPKAVSESTRDESAGVSVPQFLRSLFPR